MSLRPNIFQTGSIGRERAESCFDPLSSHPKAADGFTLSHRDKGIRQFWIEHGIACREIGAAMGKALGKTCITNVWIPDGYKDTRGPKSADANGWRSLSMRFLKSRSRPNSTLIRLNRSFSGLDRKVMWWGRNEFCIWIRDLAQKTADPRRRSLSSYRRNRGQNLERDAVSARDPIARQPRGPLGQ